MVFLRLISPYVGAATDAEDVSATGAAKHRSLRLARPARSLPTGYSHISNATNRSVFVIVSKDAGSILGVGSEDAGMAIIVNNGTGGFTGRWTPETENLVAGIGKLGPYIQHWMGRYIGKKPDEVLLGTPFSIPKRYNNKEGCIYDLAGEKGFVKGLRVDLQKAQTVGANTYATFQVQWGTGSDGRKGGAFAGALVRPDHVFSVGDLRDALQKSVASQSYWRIDP